MDVNKDSKRKTATKSQEITKMRDNPLRNTKPPKRLADFSLNENRHRKGDE